MKRIWYFDLTINQRINYKGNESTRSKYIGGECFDFFGNRLVVWDLSLSNEGSLFKQLHTTNTILKAFGKSLNFEQL